MTEQELEKNDDEESTSIVLPLKKRDLGNFISSLLGQQQTIERDFHVKFDIDHHWVINLHELLDQRIKQQAAATLMSFTFVIYFSNGLRRTLTTVESLKSYTETKKEIPVGIKLLWIYLVPFPGRDYAEKQEISFSAQIHSKERTSKVTAKNKILFESTILETIIGESERSSINYNIDHTERTWGDDLEAIISDQVDEVVRGNDTKDSIFNLTRLILALAILLFSFIYPIYTLSSISENSSHKMDVLKEQYNKIITSTPPTIEVIERKMDQMANLVSESGKREEGIGKLFLVLFFGPSIALIILRLTRKETSSFLVLSKESEIDRKRKLKRENRSHVIVATSYVFAIIGSIVANYGYAWLTG
ncbi:MAG: hypothetical protein AB2729_08850 [Candidatus Thiodiazotropha taylori]